MPLLAHHMAVEIFGREFAPHSTLDHICAFAAIGTVLALAGFGAWTLAARALAGGRDRAKS
jgi:hypothetical protein